MAREDKTTQNEKLDVSYKELKFGFGRYPFQMSVSGARLTFEQSKSKLSEAMQRVFGHQLNAQTSWTTFLVSTTCGTCGRRAAAAVPHGVKTRLMRVSTVIRAPMRWQNYSEVDAATVFNQGGAGTCEPEFHQLYRPCPFSSSLWQARTRRQPRLTTQSSSSACASLFLFGWHLA